MSADRPQGSDASFAQGLATADLSMGGGGGATLEGEGWAESPVRPGAPPTAGDDWEVMPPTPARGETEEAAAEAGDEPDPEPEFDDEGVPPEMSDAADDDVVSEAPPPPRAAAPSRPKPERKRKQ
eukprot:COSAG02_NODE_26977_length_619_cov_90.367308_1_plen_124_part_10